jgi:IS30 family transposase
LNDDDIYAANTLEDQNRVTLAPVYFCDSRSPWQRGSNENSNGLLRDYFPKGTDLSTHSTQHLLAVENELNNPPRLILNDRAPAELSGRSSLASKNRPCCDVIKTHLADN